MANILRPPPQLHPLFRVSSGVKRLFAHGFDLLVQHVHLAAPVVAAAKPGEIDGKHRVLPAPREPCAVVDEAQRAQGLDERQLAAVKAAKLLVAFQQRAELLQSLANLRA